MNAPLRRSSADKLIGGVCGGLGRRFGIDTVVVRLMFLAAIFLLAGSALMLLSGAQQFAARLFVLSGLSLCFSPLLYLILWVAMPREPEAPGALTAHAPGALAAQAADDPVHEWKFDPYTGRPVEHERGWR